MTLSVPGLVMCWQLCVMVGSARSSRVCISAAIGIRFRRMSPASSRRGTRSTPWDGLVCDDRDHARAGRTTWAATRLCMPAPRATRDASPRCSPSAWRRILARWALARALPALTSRLPLALHGSVVALLQRACAAVAAPPRTVCCRTRSCNTFATNFPLRGRHAATAHMVRERFDARGCSWWRRGALQGRHHRRGAADARMPRELPIHREAARGGPRAPLHGARRRRRRRRRARRRRAARGGGADGGGAGAGPHAALEPSRSVAALRAARQGRGAARRPRRPHRAARGGGNAVPRGAPPLPSCPPSHCASSLFVPATRTPRLI